MQTTRTSLWTGLALMILGLLISLRTLSSQPWLYFALAVLILAHDHSF